MQNILYWFIEGQTHFGMPRGANMDCSLFKPPHRLQACNKNLLNMEVLYAKQPTLAKTPVELKDNAVISIVFTTQPCIFIESQPDIHMLSCSCWSFNALPNSV